MSIVNPSFADIVNGFMITKKLKGIPIFPKDVETKLFGLVMEYSALPVCYYMKDWNRDKYTFESCVERDSIATIRQVEVVYNKETDVIHHFSLTFSFNKAFVYSPNAFDRFTSSSNPIQFYSDDFPALLYLAKHAKLCDVDSEHPLVGWYFQWKEQTCLVIDKDKFLRDVEATFDYFWSINWDDVFEKIRRESRAAKKVKATAKRKSRKEQQAALIKSHKPITSLFQ